MMCQTSNEGYIEHYHDDARLLAIDVVDDENNAVNLTTASTLEFDAINRSDGFTVSKRPWSGVQVDPGVANRMLIQIYSSDFRDRAGLYDWRARVVFLSSPSTVISGIFLAKDF